MAKSTGEPRVWKIPEGSGDPLFDALAARPGTAVIDSAAMGKHGDIPFDPHQTIEIHEQAGGIRPPLLNGGRTIRGASVVTRVKRTKKVVTKATVAKKTTAKKTTRKTTKPKEPEIVEEEVNEEMGEPTIQVSFSSSFGTIRDFYHDVMIQNSWLILIRDADYKGSSYQPPAPTEGQPPPILDIQVTDGSGPDIFTGKVVSLGISFELDGYGLIVTVLGVM